MTLGLVNSFALKKFYSCCSIYLKISVRMPLKKKFKIISQWYSRARFALLEIMFLFLSALSLCTREIFFDQTDFYWIWKYAVRSFLHSPPFVESCKAYICKGILSRSAGSYSSMPLLKIVFLISYNFVRKQSILVERVWICILIVRVVFQYSNKTPRTEKICNTIFNFWNSWNAREQKLQEEKYIFKH